MSSTLEQARQRILNFADFAEEKFHEKSVKHCSKSYHDEDGKKNSCGQTLEFSHSRCDGTAQMNIRMTSDNHVKVTMRGNFVCEDGEFTSQDDALIKQAIESFIDLVNYTEDTSEEDEAVEGLTFKKVSEIAFDDLEPGTLIIPGVENPEDMLLKIGQDNLLLHAKVIRGKYENDVSMLIVEDYEHWDKLPKMCLFPYASMIENETWTVSVSDAE